MVPVSTPVPPATPQTDPSLAELVQYSTQAQLRKPAPRETLAAEESLYLSPMNWSGHGAELNDYAAPIMPLRGRDWQALSALFTLDNMPEIENDVLTNLMNRHPEPCWEDASFEFLKDYL